MRQIADVLRDLAGDQYEEITTSLAEVVRATMETGKVGALTIALKIRPTASNAVQVECDIKTKVPVKPTPPTIFFVANEDSLVRQDPNQMRLPLKPAAVDDGPMPLKPAATA